MNKTMKLVRGRLFDFKNQANPFNLSENARYFEDGLLVIEDGKIFAAGDYRQLIKTLPANLPVEDFGDCFILPGFVDAHVHSVQTKAIASDGGELLDWLQNHIFANERQFENADYAYEHTRFFFHQLLKNGTTTAAIFPSIHPVSTEAVFEIASKLKMCIIAGKTMMDRNAPEYLLESPQKAYDNSKALIEKWHHKGRLHYAVTPRFAVTSSPEAFKMASALLKEFDKLYLQTHISENETEVIMVKGIFPVNHNYLNVYDSFGLLTDRTLLGHGIYLSDEELERIAEVGSAIVHCPSSNLFLGSGLFDFQKVINYQISLAVGSDVGAGTSFSMLSNLSEAYKIAALRKRKLYPFQAIYFATLGGARALSLENEIGNFDAGKAADFVVLDPSKIDLLAYRIQDAETIEETLFALIILGNDRLVKATYVMGEAVYKAGEI
jgi:guanine deaminase